jgi:hypothetical protein
MKRKQGRPSKADNPWIIICTDPPCTGLYWSNLNGWGSKQSASRFNNSEKRRFELPIAGCWVRD